MPTLTSYGDPVPTVPPDFDEEFSPDDHDCEFCKSAVASVLVMLFLEPTLLCWPCYQLSYDDVF